MKIAYLLSWELSKEDGVTKKVLAQAREWINAGHQTIIFCIATSSIDKDLGVPTVLVQRRKKNNIVEEYFSIKQAYKDISRKLESYSPDIIYHRSEIYQSELGKIMSQYLTVEEINSNDLTELRQLSSKSLKGRIRYLYYKLIRDKYFSKAAGFCCVTNEIAELGSISKYNKPITVVPNTIVSDKYQVKSKINDSNLPRLLFMGTPNQEWHGIDKIIELARATVNLLEIELIGPSKPDLDIPPNIRFHGFLTQEQYEKVVVTCDIGICTMALHRKEMYEASPLKTREYLAYGLPIITGYLDTAFIYKRPEWVLQLDNNENNIKNNVESIIEFSNKFKGYRLNKSEVEEFIDIQYYEHNRITFFERIINKHAAFNK